MLLVHAIGQWTVFVVVEAAGPSFLLENTF